MMNSHSLQHPLFFFFKHGTMSLCMKITFFYYKMTKMTKATNICIFKEITHYLIPGNKLDVTAAQEKGQTDINIKNTKKKVKRS